MAPVTRRRLAAETTNNENEFGLFAKAGQKLMKRALHTAESDICLLRRTSNVEVDLRDLNKYQLKKLCKLNGFPAPPSWTNAKMVSALNDHKQQLLRRKEMKIAQVSERDNLEQEVESLKERLRRLISEKEAYLAELEDKNKIHDDLEKEIIQRKNEKAKCLPRHGEEGLYEDISTAEYNRLLERVEQGARRLATHEEEMRRLKEELDAIQNRPKTVKQLKQRPPPQTNLKVGIGRKGTGPCFSATRALNF